LTGYGVTLTDYRGIIGPSSLFSRLEGKRLAVAIESARFRGRRRHAWARFRGGGGARGGGGEVVQTGVCLPHKCNLYWLPSPTHIRGTLSALACTCNPSDEGQSHSAEGLLGLLASRPSLISGPQVLVRSHTSENKVNLWPLHCI
jgi:hypothetical protein